MIVNAKNLSGSIVVLLSTFAITSCKSGGAGVSGGPEGSVYLEDPSGDDKGPGTYVYPTADVYGTGSFDLRKFEVIPKGEDVEFRVTLNRRIEDPWDSKAWGGNGFSLQMAFIHIDTDRKPGSGVQESAPGMNVRFKAEEAWDKAVILSPQGPTRVNSEIEQKAPHLKDHLVVPKLTRASGKTLVAVVSAAQLGGVPKGSWGYQVLVQSNEGFPAKTDLLTRKVNEFEGEHRFGGGSDYDNDPHVIDMLVAPGKGASSEADGQYKILGAYNKDVTDPKLEDLAEVPMVYPNG